MTDSVTVRGVAGWSGDFDGAGDPFIEGAKATVAMLYHFQDTAQFCTERLHWVAVLAEKHSERLMRASCPEGRWSLVT